MLIQPTPDDVAELMKRFADAGWIQGSAQVHGKGAAVFNAKGAKRMRELAATLAELGVLTHGQFSALIGLSLKFREDHGPH